MLWGILTRFQWIPPYLSAVRYILKTECIEQFIPLGPRQNGFWFILEDINKNNKSLDVLPCSTEYLKQSTIGLSIIRSPSSSDLTTILGSSALDFE